MSALTRIISMNSLIKNAQSKIQEKDYANAFALSSEAIEQSGTKPALNLLMLHATCAQHVEKYDVSSKYFMAAVEIDKDGQFHQRIWKVGNGIPIVVALTHYVVCRACVIFTKK